jgi:hypothetical protein
LKLSKTERSLVHTFLEPYRYVAVDGRNWQTTALCLQPCLQIRITSHFEAKGHTYYSFDCSLSMSSKLAPYLSWKGKRRLQHLRKGLHDVAKRELGSTYKIYFKDTPFARHGGLRGTTQRLDTWCCQLTECINARVVPPVVVAQTLKLLDAPQLSVDLCQDTQESNKDLVGASRGDSCASASTTDAELTEETASECSSYESDFESESEADDCDLVSDDESIAEDLPFEADDLQEDEEPIAPYDPSSGLMRDAHESEPAAPLIPSETNSGSQKAGYDGQDCPPIALSSAKEDDLDIGCPNSKSDPPVAGYSGQDCAPAAPSSPSSHRDPPSGLGSDLQAACDDSEDCASMALSSSSCAQPAAASAEQDLAQTDEDLCKTALQSGSGEGVYSVPPKRSAALHGTELRDSPEDLAIAVCDSAEESDDSGLSI